MKSYNGFTPGQRQKAYNWWKAEVAAGRRHWPTKCDACCQTEGVIDPHDEDYREPYGAHTCRWGLCYRCHMILHCREGSPEAWQVYVEALQVGMRFPAMESRNWPRFRADHLLSNRGHLAAVQVQAGPLPGFEQILAEGARVMREMGFTSGPVHTVPVQPQTCPESLSRVRAATSSEPHP